MVPQLKPGKLELTLMVCSLVALHTFDVYLTLLGGGLAIEANPFMVFLWTRYGLVGPLIAKLGSLGLFIFNWWVFGFFEKWGWVFRFTQSVGCVGFMLLVAAYSLWGFR